MTGPPTPAARPPPPGRGEDREGEIRLLRATQQVRVRQSRRSLPLVVATAGVLLVILWGEAPPEGLITWVLLVPLSLVVRGLLCRRIAPRIAGASLGELRRFERRLLWSSLANNLCQGSGFWWVCLYGSERTWFPVTLVCSMYAIGAMVNASIEFRSYAPTVPANLGQGVAFFSGLGGPFELTASVPIACIMVLLLAFGRENARAFAESVRIREENLELVGQLAREKAAVEAALGEARAANEEKSRFLAAASHDLRQPLHALNLFLGSLALLVRGAEPERLMSRLSETVGVLGAQFDALLDLSRFDAGGVEADLRPFRIDHLLERVCAPCRQEAMERGLRFALRAPPLMVVSDPHLLERVLGNLISNAVRYTDEGAIIVSVRAQENAARVTIADTGRGISVEDRERVFQDFVQLHNPARRREGGVGLGLPIVRRVDRLLGLGLTLDSAPGTGSRFSFQVPLAEGMDGAVPPHLPDAPGRSLHEVRVWVVEDDPDVLEALSLQLRAWGCEVRVNAGREDVEAGLEAAPPPQVMLVDDMLGTDESGLELARALGGRVAPERVLMVTGNTEPGRLRELRQSGFPVLLKPTSPAELRHAIAAVVGATGGGGS